ncbi:unnamed protein product [Clonostachys rosea f. rosea IK726]|uniref:Uncharacterized protein n=1 Tax=Clonostachys rosea f. rosea IK726 TaxID=1349383 RepID=A0ACA9UBB9_BIOOC|nr:unnamed protein product [Clonostachys rosea f. rosea IK726]
MSLSRTATGSWFNLSTRQLEKMIERAQCLGPSRVSDLQRWKANDGADFASCVERVMIITDCEPKLGPNVTLNEIDEVLDQIAASSPFTSAALKERAKQKYGQSIRRDNLLLTLFRRLCSSEAKWMIRMLSKCLCPPAATQKRRRGNQLHALWSCAAAFSEQLVGGITGRKYR